MTDDIFKKDDAPAPEVEKEKEIDVNSLFADQLKEIKNDSGEQKYATVEDALKAVKHSQEFIKQLVSENKQFREKLSSVENEVEKRKSVEEIVNNLYQRKNDSDGRKTPDPERFDENTVLELVEKFVETKLSERETLEKFSANKSAVNKTLTEKYGEKSKEVVTAQLAKLGISAEHFEKLASEAPNAALALFSQPTTGTPKVTSSSYNLPNNPNDTIDLTPEKSLLTGATEKDKKEYWSRVKQATYKKYGVET